MVAKRIKINRSATIMKDERKQNKHGDTMNTQTNMTHLDKSDSNPPKSNNVLAIDRTILANERTYQAWLRTGLTALATGLAVAKFLQNMMPLSVVFLFSTILIVFSIFAFGLAAWRYSDLHLKISDLDVDMIPVWIIKLTSLFLIGASVLAIVGLYVTLVE